MISYTINIFIFLFSVSVFGVSVFGVSVFGVSFLVFLFLVFLFFRADAIERTSACSRCTIARWWEQWRVRGSVPYRFHSILIDRGRYLDI
jgi:hypothetical protein